MDRHFRERSREGAAVTEMHRRLHLVEEPRLGEQENPRTGRAQKRAAAVHRAQAGRRQRCA